MSEWVGETGDAPSLGDNVVHDLLAELGELLTRAAEQVQQGEHQKP